MKTKDDDTDSIVDLAVAGDEQAFGRLIEQYRPRLRQMLSFRMDKNLQSRVDPSDILQEAFLMMSNRLPEYKEKKGMTFFVWLRLITMERMLHCYREHITTQKRDARRDMSLDHQLGTDATSMSIAAALLTGQSSTASNLLVKKEQRTALLSVLATMDPIDREVIALRIYEGLSNGEAAEILELTKQAASKRFIRALARLREAMLDDPTLAENFGAL